jgi:ABC-2 type transport system permease protein
MNPRMVGLVAKWEFLRYFSWKQELIGIALMIGIGLVMGVGAAFVETAKRSEHYKVAIYDTVGLELKLPADSQITLARLDDSDLRWEREQVGLEQLDGLLTIEALDRIELLVHKDPNWKDVLQNALDEAVRARRLTAAGVTAETWEQWNAPVAITVSHHEAGRGPTTRAQRIAALAFLGMLTMAVFVCFAYFFTSITTEKQARLTEQVLSAIPTQDWIDGKILGIGLHGIKAIVTLSLWAALALYGAWLFMDDPGRLTAFLGAVRVDQIAIGFLFVLLGLTFWCAFLAGVAATIDDPNNSNKSTLMFVPTIPAMIVFPLLTHPDNWAMVLLSWFPLTSMAAMPVRALLGEVAWWEVLASAALLLLAIRWMRGYAGRVFRACMMLYGKEPSWGQIWRYARRGAEIEAVG